MKKIQLEPLYGVHRSLIVDDYNNIRYADKFGMIKVERNDLIERLRKKTLIEGEKTYHFRLNGIYIEFEKDKLSDFVEFVNSAPL